VTATPRETVDQLLRATLANSADDMASLYAADVVIELPFGQGGAPIRFEGRELLRERLVAAGNQRRFTGIDEVVVRDTTDPEVVVAEYRVHGESTDGRAYALRFLMIVRVRDGLIVSSRDYGDTLAFAAAFDRLPQLLDSVRGDQRGRV
jgi:ketosteroid isomerase-like protein